MGFAIASEAKSRGARVILVSGPTALAPPEVDEVVRVQKAIDMMGAVIEFIRGTDVLIMAAAVCDYRPADYSEDKIKKGGGVLALELVENPDILTEVCKVKRPSLVVGFAAESEHIIENARRKLEKKNLDLIVANDITHPGIGFGSDYNAVTIIDRDGNIENIGRKTKEEIATLLIDKVESLLAK